MSNGVYRTRTPRKTTLVACRARARPAPGLPRPPKSGNDAAILFAFQKGRPDDPSGAVVRGFGNPALAAVAKKLSQAVHPPDRRGKPVPGLGPPPLGRGLCGAPRDHRFGLPLHRHRTVAGRGRRSRHRADRTRRPQHRARGAGRRPASGPDRPFGADAGRALRSRRPRCRGLPRRRPRGRNRGPRGPHRHLRHPPHPGRNRLWLAGTHRPRCRWRARRSGPLCRETEARRRRGDARLGQLPVECGDLPLYRRHHDRRLRHPCPGPSAPGPRGGGCRAPRSGLPAP